MIVVDTNVIAYLFISGDYSSHARKLLKHDPVWIVPYLWKSELRNVLTIYIRNNHLSIEDAQSIMNEAEEFLSGNEYDVNSFEIFEMVSSSNCSAYDCEFVALAQRLGLEFYTSDKNILKQFPEIASDLKNF
ncbi:MAG: PIN domain-containing protein [Caldithrix sp.]|nr:PIN domain-containing protein [Caldithrix sp.]